MHASRLHRLLPALALCLLLPTVALANNGVWHQGNLSIRYNALPATALPAQSLKQLGVSDSRHRGLLNILVTRSKGTAETSIPADVHARAMTENGTAVPIKVREIRDANGISYLGVYEVQHSGKLRFDLDVTPQGAATQHIQFQHEFVVD